MQAERLNFLLGALEEEPNDPFNRYAVAMEYIGFMPSEALKHLEILVENHPDYLATYYQAATLYAEQGEESRSAELFEKGIILAQELGNEKTLKELKAAFQVYQDEWED